MDAKRKRSGTEDIVKAHAWVVKHKADLPNMKRSEAIRLCQVDTGAHVTGTLMRQLENSVGVKRTIGGGCTNRTKGRHCEMRTIVAELVRLVDRFGLTPMPATMDLFKKYNVNKPSGE